MKFGLIDRVVEFTPADPSADQRAQPGRIVALKAVSLSEEYLAEHFPTFPVLPGVFMLQAMVEAASWLVRVGTGFAHSVILLESSTGVTYKSFVAPGQTLRIEVRCLRLAPRESRFAGAGYREGTEVVKGRFTLTHRNLADRDPALASTDADILSQARRRWSLLYRPPSGEAGSMCDERMRDPAASVRAVAQPLERLGLDAHKQDNSGVTGYCDRGGGGC